MNRNNRKYLYAGLLLLTAFILWTVAICFIDVAKIGPQNSKVGFATLNGFIHSLTGVNMFLYTLTDWLGLIPFFTIFVFAFLGLLQWIKRKNILKVDYSILALGVYYVTVLGFYLFFEEFVINYRPILINGILEASYPSSTTMLTLCVMPTALMQLNLRIKNHILKILLFLTICIFTVFMVIARLISGVHWFTDIIGGLLLSMGLVAVYYYVLKQKTPFKTAV